MKWSAISQLDGHFFYSRLPKTAYFFVCSKLQFCEMAGYWPSKNGRPFFPENYIWQPKLDGHFFQTAKTACFLFVVSGRPLALQKRTDIFFLRMDQTSKNGLPMISPMPIFPKIKLLNLAIFWPYKNWGKNEKYTYCYKYCFKNFQNLSIIRTVSPEICEP